MENDLVSIIMPSFNTAKFIKDSIISVINQTHEKWELLIIDDCSNDKTQEIIKTFNDPRITLIINEKNLGAALSRNLGLKKAAGKWIAFLDSDDVWDFNKLEKQIQFMKRNNCFFSYTSYREINEENEVVTRCVTGPMYINKIKMYQYCWLGCLTVMYDQNEIGLVQIENLKKNNDYAIWLKVIKKSNCMLCDEVLASYRKRKGSISNISKFKLIKYHYKLFKDGEHKSILVSVLLTLQNMFFGIIKKIKYK